MALQLVGTEPFHLSEILLLFALQQQEEEEDGEVKVLGSFPVHQWGRLTSSLLPC